MSTVREHLRASHAQAGEFHKGMAEHHATMADHHEALAEASEGDVAKIHGKISKAHQDAAKLNSDHAEKCEGMAKTIEGVTSSKAMSVDDLVPDRVQGIIREFPDLTAVPRHGAPPLNKANVSVEFAHLIATEED